ncbi:2-oxoglutarate-dependent dioxygenase 21, chloroplastic-like [Salvia hispanica]|uniref:2-oxoglutarate-dependent dioxygenase 21, chloroplastic-like n=1 Tax=Salvia hispanica TaxID=49212 RepID=UPI002009BD68|nr:2-oxoglutarate-dependent dioxygenase 21, chloroplastic-like [Salvia hispanica]
MAEKDANCSSFSMGKSAQERGLPYVPKCYEAQPFDASKTDADVFDVPTIDVADIEDPARRSVIVEQIANVCCRRGFFQIVNHGIEEVTIKGAMSVASGFLNLTIEEKVKYMSNDVRKPVRYGTSIKDGVDKVQFWRIFLKHYSHPLNNWIHMWPDSPLDYKEKMGKYVSELEMVAQKTAGLITDSVGLGPTYLTKEIDNGMQIVAVNGYPPCPEPELALGLPAHTDYCCLTLLLQDSPGLQILNSGTNTWMLVPIVEGALQVLVGDQVEVLTNGRYKSVVHRVVLSSNQPRISIAGLHSLGMDVQVQPPPEMADAHRPGRYRQSSFHDFLDFISKNDLGQGRSFLDTLKIGQPN